MRVTVLRDACAASHSSGNTNLSSKNDNFTIHLGAANIYFYINCAHRQRPTSSRPLSKVANAITASNSRKSINKNIASSSNSSACDGQVIGDEPSMSNCGHYIL